MQRIICSMVSAYIVLFALGCDSLVDPNGGFISDGVMEGIEGWDVSADIDVSPNSGTFGTPVTVKIRFNRGGGNVAAIETWQSVEQNGWEFIRTSHDRGFPIDPMYQGSNTWETADGLALHGISGILRFYALNSGGERIALGDIDVNGGRP